MSGDSAQSWTEWVKGWSPMLIGLAPFLLTWWKDRGDRGDKAAERRATALAAEHKELSEGWQRLDAGRDAAFAQLKADAAALRADRDEGWGRGRGMERFAHAQFHEFNLLTQRFNVLREVVLSWLDGSPPSERKQTALAAMKEATTPEYPPTLQEVERKDP